MALVAKCDRLIQRKENAREVARQLRRTGRASGIKRKRGRSSPWRTLQLPKKPRNENKDAINDLLHGIQWGLKRHALRKRARGCFSCPMSRDQFLSLFGGFGDTKEHNSGEKLKLVVSGSSSEVMSKIGEVLDVDASSKNWHCRRCCGADYKEQRDCACMKIDPNQSNRSSVDFCWKLERTAHIDRAGVERGTKRGKFTCKMPRGCAPVKASKKW
eukprot:CAMPEP_0185275890 /NCGR_PEP_ID=MMETSP1359-20130426/54962_1 /TAXON_ID=552665 /ORGANISM="Bigelowiella longifila, Strain CCMP242" /LENGTH=214 /DNA_ID=CAMNT_0027869381 /DNA_START=33 /DNA_END=674 /DNA_ORIENTATION=+